MHSIVVDTLYYIQRKGVVPLPMIVCTVFLKNKFSEFLGIVFVLYLSFIFTNESVKCVTF